MKKETVTTFLNTLERQAMRIADQERRQAHLNAITQCRRWLTLAWAEMLAPVKAAREALAADVRPLLEKQQQQQLLSDQELQRLQSVQDISAIYYRFHLKIFPTARRAAVEQSVRKQERVRRKKP